MRLGLSGRVHEIGITNSTPLSDSLFVVTEFKTSALAT